MISDKSTEIQEISFAAQSPLTKHTKYLKTKWTFPLFAVFTQELQGHGPLLMEIGNKSPLKELKN